MTLGEQVRDNKRILGGTMTYNGWTNRATWCVGMFLDGNYTGEGDYRYTQDQIAEAVELSGSREDAVAELESMFRDRLENDMPQPLSGVWGDLLPDAESVLDEVDWEELAEAQLSGHLTDLDEAPEHWGAV